MAQFNGIDLCQCINMLNDEHRMQALINMLRNSQSVCNDNECFDQGPSATGVLTPGNDGTQISLLTVMIGWIVIAMILYFLRPDSWRVRDNTKKNRNGNNGNDDRDHQFVL